MENKQEIRFEFRRCLDSHRPPFPSQNMTCRALLVLLPLVSLVGCSESPDHDTLSDYDHPTAPFPYGTVAKVDKENPYLRKFDPEKVYEGYSSAMEENTTYSGAIAGYRLVLLEKTHRAYDRFKSVTKIRHGGGQDGLPVFQVDIRLDGMNGVRVPVLVENTRRMRVGERVYVQTFGTTATGFATMPDNFASKWHEGFDPALLPDCEFVGTVTQSARVMIRQGVNPAFDRLRFETYGINFGSGRLECNAVDVRAQLPEGNEIFVRVFMPMNQEYKRSDKVLLRTHGNAHNGYADIIGYEAAFPNPYEKIEE